MLYKVIKDNIEDYGFQLLPEALRGTDLVYYKLSIQPEKSRLVEFLLEVYSNPKVIEQIVSNRSARLAYREMGIKYYSKQLVVTKEVIDHFREWRLEVNFSEEDRLLGITFGANNIPVYYDAEQILEKYCKDEVNYLLENGVIEKIENPDDPKVS